MADARQPRVDDLIDESLLVVASLAAQMRQQIADALDNRERTTGRRLAAAQAVLDRFEPQIAQALVDARLAASVIGSEFVLDKLPRLSREAVSFPTGFDPPPGSVLIGGGDDPIIRLPLIERAAEDLAARNIVTREVFDQLGTEARNEAFTVARQGSVDVIGRIRDTLFRSVSEGGTRREFIRDLEEQLITSELGPGHLENVFRTNIQSAFHRAHDEMASNPVVAEVFPYQEYLPIRDGRVRPEHEALGELGLSGTGVYRRDDPFWDFWTPPNGFQCFHADTKVQGQLLFLSQAWYAGQMVEIVTATGNRLTVTINHPVLTNDGFVAAGFLDEGDNLVRYEVDNNRGCCSDDTVSCSGACLPSDDAGGLSPRVHKQKHVPRIGDLFRAASFHNHPLWCPTGPDDLHGDARCTDGYIHVVRANWQLGLKVDSMGCDSTCNFDFMSSNSLASGGRYLGQSFERPSTATGGVPCGTALSDGGIPVHLGPFDFLGVGPASNWHASLNELSSDGTPVSACLYAELLHRCARQISLDKIVQVRYHEFCGHVYDAQSTVGWLVADGLIVSNCRCGVNLLTVEAAARKGVAEARKWLRTGEPPTEPEHRFDKIPFDPEPGFTRRSVFA